MSDIEVLERMRNNVREQMYYAITYDGGIPSGQVKDEKALTEAIEALKIKQKLIDLMRSSGGVYGLHFNGDPAPWSELCQGGHFEEWLYPLLPPENTND